MTITDDEIKKAEQIFLPDGFSFDDEQKDFIKCLEQSLHVQACPGSGKTTALLAKLYILSEKMPYEGNKGICVLTHTNVAIDIIKQKLGDKASKLFTYPNFFGTIQSFVDKYLAIPAYIKCFGYRPIFIDTEIQKIRMSNTYNLNKVNRDILTKLKNLHHANELFGNYTFIKNEDRYKIVYSSNKKEIIIKKPKSKKDWTEQEKEEILKAAIKLKIKVLKEDRILSFDDAFDFASRFLEKFPEINNLFSSRFQYVFIDEAQDTSAIQKDIIEKCFNDKVIIQWIGDINQSIMNDNDTESSWIPEEKYSKLSFTKSHRISQPIANIVKNVAIEKYNNLEGNADVDLKPVILLFNDNSKGYVLEKFSEIIVDKKCKYQGEEKSILDISKLSGNPIKAVGWIGKEKDNGLSIKSYFPGFDKKNTTKRKIYFPNLYTMCWLSQNKSPKEFKERIISCIVEALNLSGNKSSKNKTYSKTELINELKEKNEEVLNELLVAISTYIKDQNFENFSKKIVKALNTIYTLSNSSKHYLTNKELKEVSNINQNSKEFNVYENEKNGVRIYIDTVHGVKGETHTATLYLETKFYKTSFLYFKNELFGDTVNQQSKNQERKNKALKIAHVAFSRPTHLLCIAINKSDFNYNSNNTNNFEVIDLTLKK
jgi:superfamily I DNA/RNA helicase